MDSRECSECCEVPRINKSDSCTMCQKLCEFVWLDDTLEADEVDEMQRRSEGLKG